MDGESHREEELMREEEEEEEGNQWEEEQILEDTRPFRSSTPATNFTLISRFKIYQIVGGKQQLTVGSTTSTVLGASVTCSWGGVSVVDTGSGGRSSIGVGTGVGGEGVVVTGSSTTTTGDGVVTTRGGGVVSSIGGGGGGGGRVVVGRSMMGGGVSVTTTGRGSSTGGGVMDDGSATPSEIIEIRMRSAKGITILNPTHIDLIGQKIKIKSNTLN